MAEDYLLDDLDAVQQHCSIRNVRSERVQSDKALPQLTGGTVSHMRLHGVDIWKDMKPFWEGYRQHFAASGINLCTLLPSNLWDLLGETAAASHPFAYRCTHEQSDGPGELDTCSRLLLARFAYAQDARRRDVVIKLTEEGSMEYQINRHLAACKSLYDGSKFAGVLPPMAILDSPHEFAFIVMPMWGTRFSLHQFSTLRHVMTFIQCTLSGLSFLHRHRIAHRDIDPSNILINWYCSNVSSDVCGQRLREHYQSPAATYALFDFDLSLQLPPETSLKSCQRPAGEAFTGKQTYHPADVYQGEPSYNPFAFDVACLGNIYLAWFKEAISVVPLLAPLIGKMTTHIVKDRWSADEALMFFTEIQAGLSLDILESSVTCQLDLDILDNPDLSWTALSAEFQSRWQTHRPPPLSWTIRLLRLANFTDIGWAIIPPLRRYLRI